MAPETPRRHSQELKPTSSVPRGAYLFGALCTLALCIFAGVDAGKVRPNDGTVWLLGRAQIRVLEVESALDGTVSPLEPGDTIIGIGNTLVSSPQDAARVLSKQATGTVVPYLVERESRLLRLPVRLTEFRTAGRFYIYYAMMAAAYWLFGMWVYLKGRDDIATRLFFLMCLLFSVFFMTNMGRSSYFWGDIITQNAGALARFMMPAIFLHFFLIYPEKKIILTRYPRLGQLIYLLPLIFYVQFTIDQFFGSHAPRIYNTRWLILGVFFSAGVIAQVHSYVQTPDPLQRRHLRILTLGTLCGIVPFLILTMLPDSLIDTGLAFACTAPLIAIPLSFGYGIARYRVMEIEVLLKRRLVYFTLTASVMVAYFALVLFLGILFFRISGQTSQIVAAVATLIIAGMLWPARSYLQVLLDKRYFMTQSNLAEVLQEFGREIPRILQTGALVESVGSRLCAILDLPRMAIYLRDTSNHDLWSLAGEASANPENSASSPRLTGPCSPELMLPALGRRLEEYPEPYWIEDSEPGDTLRSVSTREQADLAERLSEQSRLADKGLALVVPMNVHGRLVGFFALPRKRGGDSFLIQDLELLTLLSGQVALQIENSRLYDEELKNQKLEEQLSLARTIQSRLLPGSIPVVEGLQLSACNITSAQVSGDYYDLIERHDGTLAIVISDVSGKGVPASLLASSLQASLRAHCDTCGDPALIIERVNRYLHASTSPEHFATLFLGIYDPTSRFLRYCSGGHDPALLRHGDGRIEELSAGGLPIGAFDFSEYEEGSAHLAPGDTLFLYTDGLTEMADETDEQFGIDRIKQVLSEHWELTSEMLIQQMKDQLEIFSGRSDADDDITLIAAKVGGDKFETWGNKTIGES